MELHHKGPCMICKGAEEDSEFDYCRACGFTILEFEKPKEPLSDFQNVIDKARGSRTPPTKPIRFESLATKTVGVVLPERKGSSGVMGSMAQDMENIGWDKALDKVAQLNRKEP